jgi:GT2 family glycosyltransferase
VSADPGGAGAAKVYVVILNWNGWRDTIACLESVLRSDYPAFQVVVCDNASTDGSMERLVAWAAGAEPAPRPEPGDPHATLFAPPSPKPVPYAVVGRAEAEGGGGEGCVAARVVFVQNGANLGFAGGCNVGMRYAIARGDCAHVWLLNNDAVVAPDALTALVARLRERPSAGQCGSRTLYYDRPDTVQCWGGARYNRWLASVRRLGDGAGAGREPDVAAVERRTDYVCAASLLVTRAFLDAVGLMEEGYFLYFEELDWATRGAAFDRAYAHRSLVYHREGRSIGTSGDWRTRSALSDYYAVRNRLVVTARFFPLALPFVYCSLIGAVLRRLARRQPDRAVMVVRILVGRGRPPSSPCGPTRAPMPGSDGRARPPLSLDTSHARDSS